jgi:hypothetical protein
MPGRVPFPDRVRAGLQRGIQENQSPKNLDSSGFLLVWVRGFEVK